MFEQSFNIKITTSAELAALKQTEAALTKQISVAKALGQEYSKAAGDLAKVQSRLGEFGAGAHIKEGILSGLDRIPVVGEAIKIASGGMAGLAAGFGLLAKGVQEFAQAEEAVAGLDAALAQSGQLTDANREKMQALAGQLQDTTAIADEKWVAVLAKLTQFGANADSINKDADAVKNLAGIMGGDLESSAMMVAKAMQGNFQAFSRLGIQIDDSLPQTEKLAKLYEELANRGAGQLEARAKTLTGQWATLKNGTSDLFESFGRGVAQTGVLQSVLYGLGRSASYLAGLFGGSVPQVGGIENALIKTKTATDNVTTAADKLKTAMGEAKTEAEGINRELGEAIRKLEELKNRGDAESRAQRNVELAQIDLDEKSGKIGAGEADRLRAESNKKFDEADYKREKETSEAKIKANESALESAYVGRVNLKAEIEQRQREQGEFTDYSGKSLVNTRVKRDMVTERDAIIQAEGALKAQAAAMAGEGESGPIGTSPKWKMDHIKSSLSEKALGYFNQPETLEGAKANLARLQKESAAANAAAEAARTPFGDQRDTIKSLEAKKAEADANYESMKRRLLPENESLRGNMGSRTRVFSLDQTAADLRLKAADAEREKREREQAEKQGAQGFRVASGGRNGPGGSGDGISGAAISQAGGDAVRGIDNLGASILGAFNAITTKVDRIDREVQASRKREKDYQNR